MNNDLTKIAKKFQDYLHEEMEKDKRYVVTMEFYIWAKDDKTVKQEAEALAKEMDAQEDNRASIVSIYEQPTGTIGNRKLFDKTN